MDLVHHVLRSLAEPIVNLGNPSFGLSVLYLVSSLFVVAAVYAASRRRARHNLGRFLRFALPARLLFHRSSLLDYRYYVINGVARALIYGALIVGGEVWSRLAVNALTGLFGPGRESDGASYAVAALTTLVFVIAFDFGYWFNHWLLHRFEILWEFHKVHHSAEVLNPFTAFRSHPVEDLMAFNMISLMTGSAHGVIVYAFGAGAQEFTLLQMNAVMLVYYLTIFHLRHSHVWLPVRGFLAYVIQSPAHHQLHHSVKPEHAGKNLGFCLSLWDWIFGTLVIPEEERRFNFGIGADGREFSSVGRLYMLPFSRAFQRIRRKLGFAPRPLENNSPATQRMGSS